MPTAAASVINAEILQHFIHLKDRQRLAHAYLLIGPALIGKSETALVLSKILNDEWSVDKAIDIDEDLLTKLKAGHPDIHYLEREYGDTIKIDDVRQILDQVKLRPFQSTFKIFIMKNIESLTLEAANALLKTLEEPSSTSLLLLTTSVPEKVLPTIRSRCQPIFFWPQPNDRIAADAEATDDFGFVTHTDLF